MTVVKTVEKFSSLLLRGAIFPHEFAGQLSDCLANSPNPNSDDAAALEKLIPLQARQLVQQTIDAALSPDYMRRPWAIGGPGPGEERMRQMTIEATERERAWAILLKPLLEAD